MRQVPNEPSLLAVPNLSEGRSPEVIAAAGSAIERAGARLLDVHSDPVHDRTVLTAAGTADELVRAAVELSSTATGLIDLRRHEGVHPRTGVLDVFPIVPIEGRSTMDDAIEAARRCGACIADLGIPVYLYGHATDPPRPLPEVRRIAATRSGRPAPDLGPLEVEPAIGVVCVGARDTLIAFNVWLATSIDRARLIARRVRERDEGLPGVRALAFSMGAGISQVSMNLTDPATTGIDDAFDAVDAEARRQRVRIVKTEIVGLVPERFLPGPDARAARLLMEPGRSLESMLREA